MRVTREEYARRITHGYHASHCRAADKKASLCRDENTVCLWLISGDVTFVHNQLSSFNRFSLQWSDGGSGRQREGGPWHHEPGRPGETRGSPGREGASSPGPARPAAATHGTATHDNETWFPRGATTDVNEARISRGATTQYDDAGTSPRYGSPAAAFHVGPTGSSGCAPWGETHARPPPWGAAFPPTASPGDASPQTAFPPGRSAISTGHGDDARPSPTWVEHSRGPSHWCTTG